MSSSHRARLRACLRVPTERRAARSWSCTGASAGRPRHPGANGRSHIPAQGRAAAVSGTARGAGTSSIRPGRSAAPRRCPLRHRRPVVPSKKSAPARTAPQPRPQRVPVRPPGSAPVTPAMVRRWAQEQGIEVADRGRIPRSVMKQYLATAARGCTDASPKPCATPAVLRRLTYRGYLTGFLGDGTRRVLSPMRGYSHRPPRRSCTNRDVRPRTAGRRFHSGVRHPSAGRNHPPERDSSKRVGYPGAPRGTCSRSWYTAASDGFADLG